MPLTKIVTEYMPSDDGIRTLSDFFDACGHETRMRMLCFLVVSPMGVNELAQALKMNQTTVSHQLRILRDKRILTCARNFKKETVYRIANERFPSIFLRIAKMTKADAPALIKYLTNSLDDDEDENTPKN